MLTEIDQQILDIDWFFTDNKNIAFVASAGGKLPISVSKSSINNEKIVGYFRNLHSKSDVIINPNLDKIFSNELMKEKYFEDFIHMAKKGLFAFDKITLNDFSDPKYQLIVTPKEPLMVSELPDEILSILMQTKLKNDLQNINIIDVLEIS